MEFGILGPLEVRDGARAVALGGLKPRALLAILLLNANRVVANARLIDLLWGDEAPERAAHSLQVQISQLRKVLEPNRRASEFSVLVSQPPGYVLHVSEEHLDAQRFERLAAAARQARAAGDLPAAVDRLNEALALWRGTPLADVAAEPFAIAEVSRLTELRLLAMEDRIDSRLGLGHHADLVAELESLVADHPLRERLCAQLMLALYRGGRQAEASDLYYRTRQRLVDELGMEPGPALQALLKDIVRQESALHPATRRTGPALAPPVRRALCPILIGREAQLERLQQALTPTHSPEGRIILLTGEAGIGKTRFASEAHQRAVAAGMEVLWGGCSEAELALPYLPFVEAIGDYLATIDIQALKRRLGPLSRELARLFPQLEEDAPITSTASDPGQARLRLFEAINVLLGVAAEPGGLLVVVEDLHWADASTRELLDYLARRLRHSRLTILVTYRSDDVGRGHALVSHLQAWQRTSLTTTIELTALQPEDVATMIRAILGGDTVGDEFQSLMHARTEGNPFVLEEMLKSAIDKGDIFRTEVGWDRKNLAEFTIPVTVRDAILQRFRRLEKEHRAVISLAAVLGEAFAYPELRVISELPELTVMAALRESVTQQLVEAESGQRFRFRHALTREAVYQDLLGPERVALHARAGEALEALSSDRGEGRYAEAAHHYLLAENFRKAFQFHVLAAQAAQRIYAVAEAIRHYSAALEATRALELPERELTDIRLLRGLVHAEAGHAADARADFEAVLESARMHGDARTEMRALSELGFLLAGAADYRQAIVRLQDSLHIAEELDDKAAQVNVLSRLSIAYTNRLRLDRGIAYGQQAERLARDLGSDAARGLAMDALLLAAVSVGDFVTADSIAPELIEIHRAQGNLWYLQFAIFQWCYASMGRGDWRQALERVDEALAINRQIGDRGNEPIYHAAHCWIHRTSGEFQRALLAGRRAVRLAEELGHPEWLAWAPFELGATLVEVGLTEDAMPLLEQGMNTAERVGAMNHLIQCTGYLAWAETLAGNAHAADVMRRRGEALLSEIVAPPGGAFLQGIHAYTGLARACLALGEDRRVEALLRPIVSAAEASGWQHPIAEASLLLGRALAARIDVGGAEVLLLRALAVATAAHLDGIRWQAHAALAHLYNQSGRRELGTTEADRARVMIGQLADRIEDSQTRERFRRGASELIQSRLWEVRA